MARPARDRAITPYNNNKLSCLQTFNRLDDETTLKCLALTEGIAVAKTINLRFSRATKSVRFSTRADQTCIN